ncbi:hypothetical protein ES703_42202 [subsurface metagenome]
MFLLFIIISINTNKIVKVHFVEKGPIIDGIIEEIWKKADSVKNFIQILPYEKEAPSERTYVYTLQDEVNLYIAFRCYTEKYKCVSCLGGREDYVTIFIDPFGSRNTAYFFTANASGQLTAADDGHILDDGRRRDDSWDGVWHRAFKIYDDYYTAEIKIPFKSIRYKKNLSEWGINFRRYIAKNNEYDSWIEVETTNMDIVSGFGVLKGINPKSTGYYFELYPELFARYDKIGEEKGEYKLRGSLNFKWDFTSEGTINATINPDFAQIESDPFTLNLSRYPVYLEERRPFFVEGSEIFRFSNFEEGSDFYTPLTIFYSRKIGKSVDGEPVPILGGLKLTNRSEVWSYGLLGAYTDDFDEDPESGFGVFRIKRKVLESFEIGMLFSGAMANSDNYNYAIGVDGAYLSGLKQLIIQGAMSDRNGKKGWAFSSGYYGFTSNYMGIAVFEAVNDSFDVNDIGYVPWSGRRRFLLVGGNVKTFQKGFIRRLNFGPIISLRKQPGTSEWSKVGGFFITSNFRNGWGFYLELDAGPHYNPDTNYFYRAINLSVWGSGEKYSTNFGGYYGYEYNYWREILAYNGSNWLSLTYTPIPRFSLILDGDMWIEWATDGGILAITPRLTPRIRLNLTKDMELSIFNEFVMEIPEANFRETDLFSNRLGLLFSWNFKPKSWLYIALNDFREQDDDGNLQLGNRVGAIKAKYLIYF